MALRGTLSHWKTTMLADALGIPRCYALGVLEALWHTTATLAPAGDIGRLPNKAIALQMDYRGDADGLIDALITSGHLDRNEQHRLLVHDWNHHSDYNTRRKLERRGEKLIGSKKKRSQSPNHNEARRVNDASRRVTTSHKSIPDPEPVPGPEPVPAATNPPPISDKPHKVRAIKQQANSFPKSTLYIRQTFPKTDRPFSAKIVAIGVETLPDIRDDEMLLMLTGSIDKTQYSSALWLNKLGPYIEQHVDWLMKQRALESLCQRCGGAGHIVDPGFYVPSPGHPGEFTLSEEYTGAEQDIACPDCGTEECAPAPVPPGMARIRDPDRAESLQLRLVGGGR